MHSNAPLPHDDAVPRGWHSRGYLPHLDASAVVQHVTYRLADSLPRRVLEDLERELQRLPQRRTSLERRKRVEKALDAGHGACLLADARAAAIVQGSFLHFDAVRYRLLAWVVMPSHVHVLVEPLLGHSLPRIVASWKSFSARRIAALPGLVRSGSARSPVWHREYWDRYIRDADHFEDVVRYIHGNPVLAGLVASAEDWEWSSARGRKKREGGGRAGLEPGGPGATLERGGPGPWKAS